MSTKAAALYDVACYFIYVGVLGMVIEIDSGRKENSQIAILMTNPLRSSTLQQHFWYNLW
jgi:hypothetical protein